MDSPLHERLRPTSLDAMVGQEPQRRALHDALTDGSSRAFMLSGPQGVGKTTMAKIAGRMLGAEVMEVAAAVNTGVDEMRQLIDTARFRSLTADYRVVILDEAHRITKNAWDASLKAIEEPPEHCRWFLCTTEPEKIPRTIRDRCLQLKLQPLSFDELRELLSQANYTEDLDAESDTIVECARAADGSARAALVNLGNCHSLDWRSARDLLHERAAGSPGVLKLCRLVTKGGDWLQATQIIASITEEPENVRISIVNYLATCLKNAKSEREAVAYMGILGRFSTPYHPGEKQAPLLLSVGRALLLGAK